MRSMLWQVIVLNIIMQLSMATVAFQTPKPEIPTAAELQLKQFLATMEQLIMNTTDRALNVTKSIYQDWKMQMSEELCHTACPIMQAYIEDVDRAEQGNATYREKRKLFARFRITSEKIEALDAKFNPQTHKLSCQLTSEEFYNTGRNTTNFDNLYMDFIRAFEATSQSLWSNMSEDFVEQQEELLELLDEISNEKELKEKDKLYDEFIETFLFKKNLNTVHI